MDVEWTVGQVPMWDGVGKDVIVRYSSGLDSGDVFYTDSNGREMLRRVRNARPTWAWQATEAVAGNYYPLTAAAAVRDAAGTEFAVLIDRAQGTQHHNRCYLCLPGALFLHCLRCLCGVCGRHQPHRSVEWLCRAPPGGSSLASGALEVMLHRTSARDDNRGVAEAVQEDECGCRPSQTQYVCSRAMLQCLIEPTTTGVMRAAPG